MDVSIVMPIHKPDKKIMNQIISSLKKQKFNGKYELLLESSGGLAENINKGIRKSKNEIVITLHQDCIPVGTNWISKLIAPLKNKEYVASVSDVELPYKLWNKFDNIAKILSSKEQKVITPLLDEKGCAYKKEALKKVGLFDEINFRTAGEDFDIYLKLKAIGKIAYPHTKVMHHNPYSTRSRLKKEYQLSEGFGTLVRIYGTNLPGWYLGILKSIPILGLPFFFRGIMKLNPKKLILISPFAFLLAHVKYIQGFWKGFLMGRQRA